jgi:pimeloyl-ACP methyl ester carboxylesterase
MAEADDRERADGAAAAASLAAARLLAGADAIATRYETPCGDGAMVWRVWGEGRPIVLLHGGSGSWMHWIRNIPVLAQRYEVWAPDLPGLGDSAMPPPPLTPEIAGEVVAEGMRRLFPVDVWPDLVTFSFGAHVGTFAAALLGARVRSLVISGSAALGLPHPRAEFLKERTSMSAAERAAVHRHNLELLMFADPARIDDLAIHIQAENVRKARFRSRPFATGDEIRRTLPRVIVPVRAIWGEKDNIARPAIGARFDVIRESHPEMEAVVIPGAGHWAAYEQADLFNEALVELLELDVDAA